MKEIISSLSIEHHEVNGDKHNKRVNPMNSKWKNIESIRFDRDQLEQIDHQANPPDTNKDHNVHYEDLFPIYPMF